MAAVSLAGVSGREVRGWLWAGRGRKQQRTAVWGFGGGGGEANMASSNRNLRNKNFIHTMTSGVLRHPNVSRNQPLKSADD